MPGSDARNRTIASRGAAPFSGPREDVQFRVDAEGVIISATPAAVSLLSLDPNDPSPLLEDYLTAAGEDRTPLATIAAQSTWAIFSARVRKGPAAGSLRRLRARGIADETGRLQHIVVAGTDETDTRTLLQMRLFAKSCALVPRSAALEEMCRSWALVEASAGENPEDGGTLDASGAAQDGSSPGATGDVAEVLGAFYGQVEASSMIGEVLLGAGPDGAGVAADLLLHILVSRTAAARDLVHLTFEHSADDTRVPDASVPAVFFTAYEMLQVLLDGDEGRPDTIRILLWGAADGTWRLVARRLSTRGLHRQRWSKKLGLLVDVLGGTALPSGYSGSGIAVAFPPFAARDSL